MKFILRLESPLCPAMGEGTAGIIDTEIATDELGIPEIPAKRFKGCLLESFDELAQWDQSIYSQNVRDRIFGKSGLNQGILYISNGHPEGYTELKKCLENLQHMDTETATFFRSDAVRSHYTMVRNQTAMDRETGVAKDKSLRTIRVIKPDVSFEFNVSLLGEYTIHDINVLENCARVLHHMGLNRTRGLGLVPCEFDKNHGNGYSKEEITDGKYIENKRDSNNKMLPVDSEYDCFLHLMLESPVILKEGYVTGTSLMGAFAAMYIMDKRKVDRAFDPMADLNFCEIFLKGGVRFQNGYPICGDQKHQRSEPNSAAYIVKKDDNKSVYFPEGKNFSQLVLEERTAIISRGFNVSFQLNSTDAVKAGISFAKNNHELNYHHSRPDDKSIGHALGSVETDTGENQRGRGELFTYEAIPRNTEFIAILTGKGKYLKVLQNLAGCNGDLLRIGRSVTAQYGCVKVKFGDLTAAKEKTETINGGECFGVLLTAPAVIPNEMGYCDCSMDTFVAAFQQELKKISPHIDIKPQTQYCRFSEYSGYNIKWRLPKVTRPAYEGGSLFVFNNEGSEAIQIPAEGIIGMYKNVGYGTYKIDRLEHAEFIVKKEEEKLQQLQRYVGTVQGLVISILDDVIYRYLSQEGFRKADRDYEDYYTHQRKSVIWQIISECRECRSKKDYSQLEECVKRVVEDDVDISETILANFPKVAGVMVKAEEKRNNPSMKELRKGELDRIKCIEAYFDGYVNQLKYRLKREQGVGISD